MKFFKAALVGVSLLALSACSSGKYSSGDENCETKATSAQVEELETKERGTREYNMALGARRANVAIQFLVGLGIDSKRLTEVSYGKERPAVLGSNDWSWSQNRRSVTVAQ